MPGEGTWGEETFESWKKIVLVGAQQNKLAKQYTVGIQKQDMSGFQMVNLGSDFEWSSFQMVKNIMAAKLLA